MRRSLAIVCAVIMGTVLHWAAYADDTEVHALLQVNGYGRKVEVKVNEKTLPIITGLRIADNPTLSNR